MNDRTNDKMKQKKKRKKGGLASSLDEWDGFHGFWVGQS